MNNSQSAINHSVKKSSAKKGQIEISFNWIFVLIAGGVILVFFIVLTKHETESSTEQTSRALSAKLEGLLSAIQQNPDAVQKQDSLNVEIEFHCDISGHWYNLKDSNGHETLESQIMFAPEIVGDSKTIAWTQLFSSPYPVVYVLYFTDEKTQYIFVDSGQNKVKELYIKMPDVFEKNLTDKESLELREDEGFRNYVIIGEQIALSGLELTSSMKKKSTFVELSEDDKKVSFRKGNGDLRGTTKSLNDETLYGAIISADVELYGCTMDKLMHSARIVGEINLERTEMIAAGTTERCKSYFSIGLPQDTIKNIISNSTYREEDNYEKLADAAASLENLNTYLARSNCPTIY